MAKIITGIIKSVGHMLVIEARMAGVKVAPTATPSIVRIAVFTLDTARMFKPANAAVRQPAMGPNNQGSGNDNR